MFRLSLLNVGLCLHKRADTKNEVDENIWIVHTAGKFEALIYIYKKANRPSSSSL